MSVTIDIFLLIVIGLVTFKNYLSGFIKSVLGLGRLILAVIICAIFGYMVSDMVQTLLGGKVPALLAGMLGYVLLFTLSCLLLTFAVNIISKIVTSIKLVKLCDKLLGAALGFVSGLLIICFISTVSYGIFDVLGKPEIYEDSFVFKFTYDMDIFGFISDKFAQ